MFGRNKVESAPETELFTIFDTKTGSYDLPSFAINGPDMVRAIHNLFARPERDQNRLWINAEDFQLFRIGTYCKKTGRIEALTPQHIVNLHEIKTAVLADQPHQTRDVRETGFQPGLPQ